MNANALKPPRTAWSIEAAMYRAIENGAATASNARGGEIVTIIHDRHAIPAFSFYRNCVDVSDDFRKALRASVQEVSKCTTTR